MTNVVKHFKWELRGKRRLHILRGPSEGRSQAFDALVAGLRVAARFLAELKAA